MPGSHYLVLDQGGQSSRALLYQTDGVCVRHAIREVATQRPAPGRVEQDPEELVSSLVECIASVVGQEQVVAAGLACQRASVLCWNRRTGAALTPVLSWQDTRAHALFEILTLDPEAVRATTGLPPSAHYGASKLAWCLQHIPAVAAARDAGELCVGPLAAFLSFRLLAGGPYFATPTLAQRTLLFDIRAGAWSGPLSTAFGLSTALLPALMPDCAQQGHLEPSGIPLRVCVGDQNAMPFACGHPDPHTLYLNAGTGAFLLRPLDNNECAPPGLLTSVLPDGTRAAEGTINGAGSALSWFADHAGTTVPWEALNALESLPTGAPLFINSVGDLGSPYWRTGVVPRFAPDRGTPLERAYAVVESIAFLARANVERMRAGGLTLQRGRIAGGIAASDFFCRLLATTLDLPIERSADLEATARGVLALLGGAADDIQPVSFPVQRDWVGKLHGRYAEWERYLL